jgi:hypothetical protein
MGAFCQNLSIILEISRYPSLMRVFREGLLGADDLMMLQLTML